MREVEESKDLDSFACESQSPNDDVSAATNKKSDKAPGRKKRSDVEAKTLIRVLKRFITEKFNASTGYLSVPRHKRIAQYPWMSAQFLRTSEMEVYIKALVEAGISMEDSKSFINYLIKPEFLKNTIQGSLQEACFALRDALTKTTSARVDALWATPHFRTLFRIFYSSGAMLQFSESDATLRQHLPAFIREVEARVAS